MPGSKHFPSNEVNIKRIHVKPSISTNYFSHNRVVQQLLLLEPVILFSIFLSHLQKQFLSNSRTIGYET